MAQQPRCGSDESVEVLDLMDEDIVGLPTYKNLSRLNDDSLPLTIPKDTSMGCGVSAPVCDNRVFFDGYIRDGTRLLRSLPHTNALQTPYPCFGGLERYPLKAKQLELDWSEDLAGYNPTEFTAAFVLNMPPWADNQDVQEVQFNCFDPKCRVDRTSHEGEYAIDPETNRPLNPRGRTGLTGRGSLGRFGPNHAADPVISTWTRNADGSRALDEDGNPILKFVAIRRKDTGDWAIPGGMVDPGENVSLTLKREFGEETMASMDMSSSERDELMLELDRVFQRGVLVYSGYVDDIRNTDNAWIETTCVNFHDETGQSFSKFKLAAGDDAGDVAWTDYYEGMPLYATHTIFLSTVYKMRSAWYKHSGGH